MSTSTLEPRITETIQLRPIVDWHATGERERAMHDPAAIRPGLPVVCQDGKVGRFVHMFYHGEGSAPAAIVVRRGFLRKRDYIVPWKRIAGCSSDRIVLDLMKQDLASLPMFRPDYEIADDLQRAFHAPREPEDYSAFLGIATSVEAGVLELSGNVCSGIRRRQAELIAGAVPGVLDVRNRLVADDELAAEVDRALKRVDGVTISRLRVDVFLGLVRLRGTVGSSSQRALATSVARSFAGVRAINNALQIEVSCSCRSHASPTANRETE